MDYYVDRHNRFAQCIKARNHDADYWNNAAVSYLMTTRGWSDEQANKWLDSDIAEPLANALLYNNAESYGIMRKSKLFRMSIADAEQQLSKGI